MKIDKMIIFCIYKGAYRKRKIQSFHLKFFMVWALPIVSNYTKFQLNRLTRSRDIVVILNGFISILNFSAFRKNSIKIFWFNIFYCGLRQTSSNTFVYHIYQYERHLIYSIEQYPMHSVVAYVQWLLNSLSWKKITQN